MKDTKFINLTVTAHQRRPLISFDGQTNLRAPLEISDKDEWNLFMSLVTRIDEVIADADRQPETFIKITTEIPFGRVECVLAAVRAVCGKTTEGLINIEPSLIDKGQWCVGITEAVIAEACQAVAASSQPLLPPYLPRKLAELAITA